jgi:hypothetical protein
VSGAPSVPAVMGGGSMIRGIVSHAGFLWLAWGGAPPRQTERGSRTLVLGGLRISASRINVIQLLNHEAIAS